MWTTEIDWATTVKSRISQTTLRHRLAATLDRVSRGDEFVVARGGKPLAALIPALKFDVMDRAARRRALASLKQQRSGTLTDAQAMALGLKAQRRARRQRRRTRRSAEAE